MKERTVMVEATLYEPEEGDLPATFMIAYATLHRGDGLPDLHCGSFGHNLWLYLDEGRAIQVDGKQLYQGAVKALENA